LCKPVANLITVQRFARCSFQNFANDFLGLLLRERTIFCLTFGPLDPETDFPRLASFIPDSLWRSVVALFPFERSDSDFGRPLQPLADCACIAAYPVRRTRTGVLSEAWHSHNKVTTFTDVNDVVTCTFVLGIRDRFPTWNLFAGSIPAPASFCLFPVTYQK